MAKWFLCGLAVLLVTVVCGPGFAADDEKSEVKELQVGDKAPPFVLTGSDGKKHDLKKLTEKQAVVIAWFPKAFTGGCTKECTSFAADGALLKAFDVAYFTASCDTVELNTKFAESVGADYPILSDPEKKVTTAYGVVNDSRPVPFRYTFYIDKGGKILFIDKEVKAANHAADVATKLALLGVAKKK